MFSWCFPGESLDSRFPPGKHQESRRTGFHQAFPWWNPGIQVRRLFRPPPGLESHEIRQRFPTAQKTAKICEYQLTSINLIFPTVSSVLRHLVFSHVSPMWTPFQPDSRKTPGKHQGNPWRSPGVFLEWCPLPPGVFRVGTRKTPGKHQGNAWGSRPRPARTSDINRVPCDSEDAIPGKHQAYACRPPGFLVNPMAIAGVFLEWRRKSQQELHDFPDPPPRILRDRRRCHFLRRPPAHFCGPSFFLAVLARKCCVPFPRTPARTITARAPPR